MTGAVRQDSPLEILAFRINLSFIVEGPKLGHQIGGVLCCVHSQRLGDDQERSSKLSNSQLLSGTLRKRVEQYFSTGETGVQPTLCSCQINSRYPIAQKRNPFFIRLSHHAGSVILKVDRQSCLHSTSTRNYRLWLQHPLDHTEGIMQRTLHLVTHEVVGPAQNDGCWCACFGTEGIIS